MWEDEFPKLSFELNIENCYCCSDSQVALTSIKTVEKKLKPLQKIVLILFETKSPSNIGILEKQTLI